MHGAQVVGLEGAGVLDRPGGGGVEVVDEHDDGVGAHGVRLGQRLGVLVQLDVLGLIRAIEPHEAVDHDRARAR